MIENFITKLTTQLKSKEYHVRYPQLLDKSPKTHVLFFAPYLNATGLYRVILPYMQLNQSKTHAAIITELIPNTIENKQKQTNWHVSDEMIEWADIIVFPTVTDDLTENIKLLRQINKKPHLKFFMDIDDNYHIDQPGQDPKKVQESRTNLLKNMSMCNAITCTNAFLGNYYLNLLHQSNLAPLGVGAQLTTNNQQPTSNIQYPAFLVMPNFMSTHCLENVKITEPKPTKIRIGITTNRTQNHFSDLTLIRKILINMQKKHKDKIELVLFGWSGRIIEKGTVKDALNGVKYTYIDQVPLHEYYNKLSNLQLNFALMPMRENDFCASKSHHKLLQYAQIGVPAIVTDVLPYREIIAPDSKSMFEPGYLPVLKCRTEEDWVKNLDFLIENEAARKNISEKAKQYVNEYFMWENKPNFACNTYK